MDANQLKNSLEFAEVNGVLAGDTRRMMQEERVSLMFAMKSGDREAVAAAMTEARRVAKMWGVDL